jgi:hypothetical protein
MRNFMVLLCLFALVYGGCSQEKKVMVTENQVSCEGFAEEAITGKVYSNAIDVSWRNKFTLRVLQDGKIQLISPEYSNKNMFDYIKDFSWEGVSIPLDGETYTYKMENGKIMVMVKTKDYLAINFNGVYNLVARCPKSFELSNSMYFNINILEGYNI